MATLQRPAQRTTTPPGALLCTLGVLYALVAFVAAFALFIYTIPFLVNLRYSSVRWCIHPSTSARLPPSSGRSWSMSA
jgi:hypothetical protein